MREKFLVIDRAYGDASQVKNYVALMPGVENPVPWQFTFEESLNLTGRIVRTKAAIADVLAKEWYASFLPYKTEALTNLFYAFGNPIVFLLGDRLARINRLLKYEEMQNLTLPFVNYTFDTAMSYDDFLFKHVEVDPAFNQWILNVLLSGAEEKQTPEIPKLETETSKAPPRPRGSLLKWLVVRIKRLMTGELKVFYATSILLQDFAKSGFARALTRYQRKVLSYTHSPIWQPFTEKKFFFWPLGPLFPLPELLPQIPKDAGKVSRKIPDVTKNKIASLFAKMLEDCEGVVRVSQQTLFAAAELVETLQSKVVVEDVAFNCQWVLEVFRACNSKKYFTNSSMGLILSPLYAFACNELGVEFIGCQHSAWGGYLAGGALVTELLILGADDYVTFGWKERDEQLSCWKRSAVPLPSPVLSQMSINSKSFSPVKRSTKKVLLSPGFLYRFPSIYNSFLRLDTVNIWVDVIEEIIASLARAGIDITLIMYDKRVARIFESAMKRWLKAGGTFIREFHDHTIRVRHLMTSGELLKEYDAIIWDLPAGGFSEALSCGIPTFALWNEELIRSLPEGKVHIDALLRAGILFSNGAHLAETLSGAKSIAEWFLSSDVQIAVQNFKDGFFRTDESWDSVWKTAFRKWK